MRLLSAALQLWLRQQCERLDSLELELQGSTRALLKGRLEGLRVRARGVCFQQLQLELVELTTGPLQLQMGSLWRGQAVLLQEPFVIRGMVSFTGAGLSHSLAQPRWRPLADQLAEELVGITPLVGLRMGADRLVLAARGLAEPRPVEVHTAVQVYDGGLALLSEDGSHRSLLPMDDSLRLAGARVEAGLLVLEGEATVTP